MIIPKQHKYESFDHDYFNYLCWSNSSQPKTIIIAVHGINGAASDYDKLAQFLTSQHQNIIIYAIETRGQGNDLNVKRRGDIQCKKHWFKDLDAFSKELRIKNPTAEIIWCGESMGSLIVSHCYSSKSYFIPDRMILLAPVVSLRPHLPIWKYQIVKCISYILPRYRVSLTQLSGDQTVKVTQSSDNHDEQAATNSYFVEKFTLRLLVNLGNLISSMISIASKIDCPVIVLNGGNDYFTPAEYAESFYSGIPISDKNKHAYFDDAYHLLMYDTHQELIFREILEWIKDSSRELT